MGPAPLSGDTLYMEGYPKPIRFPDSADLERLAAGLGTDRFRITVTHWDNYTLRGAIVESAQPR